MRKKKRDRLKVGGAPSGKKLSNDIHSPNKTTAQRRLLMHATATTSDCH